MYRGTPYLNRNIKKKQQERSMQFHMNNLTQIRPRTGTIEHVGEIHINNKKGQMQKQARFTQIQRENRILLQKISSIMGKQKIRNRGESQQKLNKSLNSQFRRRQLQNIQIQNAKLLKRLQDRKANYQTQKFKESWRKQKYVIKNLSNYPYVLSEGRKKRSSFSHIGNRQSKLNTIQMCRMRVIDEVSFLVTVRLNQQKLQIIGDTKDKRQIKVIQIDRDQAIQFIQQQCRGKIQNIFNCLRYDKVDQVMYLVANQVQIDEVKNQQNSSRKNKVKRQQNPQFDISLDPQQKNSKIPIHVTGAEQTRKYWIQVEKKNEIKVPETRKTQKKVEKEQLEQAQDQQREKLQQNENHKLKMKSNAPKIQSGVNTYNRIKKFTEQSIQKQDKKYVQQEEEHVKKQNLVNQQNIENTKNKNTSYAQDKNEQDDYEAQQQINHKNNKDQIQRFPHDQKPQQKQEQADQENLQQQHIQNYEEDQDQEYDQFEQNKHKQQHKHSEPVQQVQNMEDPAHEHNI